MKILHSFKGDMCDFKLINCQFNKKKKKKINSHYFLCARQVENRVNRLPFMAFWDTNGVTLSCQANFPEVAIGMPSSLVKRKQLLSP